MNKNIKEHGVAQNRATPVAIMEVQHSFQDLSLLVPLMKEVLCRTSSMEGKIEKHEMKLIKSAIEKPRSGMMRKNN